MPKFLRFTDREGRVWRVYQFSRFPWMPATAYEAPGGRSGQVRGFVPEEGGVRRLYALTPLLPRTADDLEIGRATLQRQLDESRVDERDRAQS